MSCRRQPAYQPVESELKETPAGKILLDVGRRIGKGAH